MGNTQTTVLECLDAHSSRCHQTQEEDQGDLPASFGKDWNSQIASKSKGYTF